ncbi:hypothetical protein BH23CHL4_BH23CHL4_02940 [soil metagenome]
MSNAESKWLDRVSNTWNDRAAAWDTMSEANAQTSDRRADLDHLMASLHLTEGSRLLDAGCGTGQFAIAFAQRGCRVTGIDVAASMIDLATEHSRTAGVDVEWRTGDVSRLDDAMAVYDAIMARMVLQFSANLSVVFGEFRRVLKPGGRLLASVPGALSPIYAGSWRRHIEPDHYAVNFMVPWELEDLLAHFGWTVLEQWGDTRPAGSGHVNALAGVHSEHLDKRLQQAVSTTWAFIAR